VHLWLLRKQKNRLLWEGAASLIVFSALLYTGDRQLYATFLLLIFIMDTAGEYILHIIVPVFILLTWPLSYAPFVWTLME
ncbi:histidine kinase, partial [Erysipelatoclostridium ramosum]|nr:histidine kinase [Thomasclavelia ramosa]